MLKALIKKDFKKFFAAMTTKNGRKNRKGKIKTGKGSVIGMIILWVIVFASLGMAFMGMGAMFADALIPAGLPWLFFALIGITGFLLSVIGNGFSAYSNLFKAKDNELLLSMPIPEGYILFSRMSTIFVMSIVYSAVYLIPSAITFYGFEEYRTPLVFLSCIVLILANAFLVTGISALIGWLIAAISRHIKNKSAATTVFTLVFLGAYYYIYFNIQKYLGKLLEAGIAVSESIRTSVFTWPLYQFGLAASGDMKALGLYSLFCIIIFVAVYRILSVSFNKIVTSSEKKQSYTYEEEKQEQVELQSPKKALVRKELARFTSSPTYMINCGLGIIILIAASVMLFIKKDMIKEMLISLEALDLGFDVRSYIPLICTAVMIFGISSIDITAPSISLEGKNLWILRAMPVKTGDVFYAKEMLQYYMSVPPMAILFISILIVFKLDYSSSIYILICSALYLELHAMMGLVFNLKFPKLDWSNEAEPVKQSLSVMFSLFGGWILVASLGALYWFVLKNTVEPDDYLLVILVVFAVLVRMVQKWLRTKGTEIFEAL